MRSSHRIVSFLPAATEIVYALGLDDRLVGVTHECDFPAAARDKPAVVRSAIRTEGLSPAEIDRAVSARMGAGETLYEVDEELLRQLSPDAILTQDLCQVCAPSGNEVTRVLRTLASPPEIVWLTPRNMTEIEQNIRAVAEVAGCPERAERLIGAGRSRLARLAEQTRRVADRPRVSFLEWVDPIFCGGHWVPEMIDCAGGVDDLGQPGADSVRIEWSRIVDWAPEVIVVAPCGFHLAQSLEQARHLVGRPGWSTLPAVRAGRVYAVDANAYFARPGPRVVEGTELLAHLLHPDRIPWNGPADVFQRL